MAHVSSHIAAYHNSVLQLDCRFARAAFAPSLVEPRGDAGSDWEGAMVPVTLPDVEIPPASDLKEADKERGRGKEPTRRNPRYKQIDAALKEISGGRASGCRMKRWSRAALCANGRDTA